MPTGEAAIELGRALVLTSHIPVLLLDGRQVVVAVSDSFCENFHRVRDQVLNRPLTAIGEGEWNIPQLATLADSAFQGAEDLGRYETDLRHPDGTVHNLVVDVRRVVKGATSDARILMVLNDVTQIRRVERENAALLHEKDRLLEERVVLLQEMQHRVANSLQIIASVLLLKARAVSSEESRLHLQDAHDRVMSIAAVQQHLQPNSGEVDVEPYLKELCSSLASSMMRGGRGLALEVHADHATVTSQEATSLGLIVTELVINCLKHAFPNERSGVVRVVYEVGSSAWKLSVSDNGVGMPVEGVVRKEGLGTHLVEVLAHQLEAQTVTTDASPGTRVEISGPVLRTGDSAPSV